MYRYNEFAQKTETKKKNTKIYEWEREPLGPLLLNAIFS